MKNSRGYTVVELMVALVLTGILATACLDFYSAMNNQTLTQEEISDLQHNSRNTLHEMAQTVRMAGYKVGAHAPYAINGDTLYIFYNGTQPIDTMMYFLISRYSMHGDGAPQPHYLMRQLNSEAPAIFTDWITDITYTATSANTLEIALEVQTTKSDEDYTLNHGYRTYTVTESVVMRNLSL
jgi:prepilin-type N-terminal cleavage/methylation domain-containing protein